MCAIIREVVVLPLVPVTATTGTRGRIVVGPGPGSVPDTVAAASATSEARVADALSPPVGSMVSRVSRTTATDSPSARARLRSRHG